MSDLQRSTVVPASVLQHLEHSIKAEQIFCSYVTQMKFLPQFKENAALSYVHRENYETSYHRNTAAGNLQRMLELSERDEMLVLMTIECFVETRAHDKKAESALIQIPSFTAKDEVLLTEAKRWHQIRKRQLTLAARALYTSVGPEVWQKGVTLAE